MLGTVVTVLVYVVLISTATYLVVELYRFVKSRLTKEPETETPETTLDLFDLPESQEPPKKPPLRTRHP